MRAISHSPVLHFLWISFLSSDYLFLNCLFVYLLIHLERDKERQKIAGEGKRKTDWGGRAERENPSRLQAHHGDCHEIQSHDHKILTSEDI